MPASPKKGETPHDHKLIAWVDVETTSLEWRNPSTLLLEVGIHLSTLDLVPVPGGDLSLVVHWDDQELRRAHWHDVAYDMHQANGLYRDCAGSGYRLDRARVLAARWLRRQLEAYHGTSDFLPPYWGGCSTFLDRVILERDMPELTGLIFYRVIDASMCKTIVSTWINKKIPRRKETNHRALEDAVGACKLARDMRDHLQIASRSFAAPPSRVPA